MVFEVVHQDKGWPCNHDITVNTQKGNDTGDDTGFVHNEIVTYTNKMNKW